jgi:hypothetical protein
MRVADRPGGVWTMQRRAQVEQIEPRSAGRIQPAYCDWPNAMSIYVTLRRTVRTLPSGRGRVRHAWIARTPARYPTGAGRTGTPSPESPYVPRRFRSRRPDWVRMMRLSAPANTGRTEQYAGRLTLSGRRPSRGRPKRQDPASIHETGPCLCGRQVGAGGGSAPTSRSGGLGLDLGTVTSALPKFRATVAVRIAVVYRQPRWPVRGPTVDGRTRAAEQRPAALARPRGCAPSAADQRRDVPTVWR